MRKISCHIVMFLMAVTTTISCEQESIIDMPTPQKEKSEVNTRSEIARSLIGIQDSFGKKKVTKEFLPIILSGMLDREEFRTLDKYKVETVSKDGRDLLFIVNFEGGGWAIVSGRYQKENQILACSPEGEFLPGRIESPEVRYWLEMTESQVEKSIIQDERLLEEQRGHVPDPGEEPYYWAKIYYNVEYSSSLYEEVGHLTTTKWGQNEPWNYMAPVQNGQRCPLGCTAVAFAQMLYYLHYNIGNPSGLYHQIDTSYTWISSLGKYESNLLRSDWNDPSSRWDLMKTVQSSFNFTYGSILSGNFILDVADRIETLFSKDGSTAYFNTNIFADNDIFCTTSGYNYNTVKNNLDNSRPVIIRGTNTSSVHYGDGHAWLIDGFKTNLVTTDVQYQWVIIPTDSLAYYATEVLLTESQKQILYPNVQEYDIEHNYTYSYDTKLKMNWGWNGSYNSGLYSIIPGWEEDAYFFSSGIQIMYGFQNY